MASLAILGFGVLLVIQLFSGGLSLARASQDSTYMTLLAREKMSETLSLKSLKEGVESGQTNGLSWKIEISPFETPGAVDNPKLHIFKVAVNVTNPSRKSTLFTLTSVKTVVE